MLAPLSVINQLYMSPLHLHGNFAQPLPVYLPKLERSCQTFRDTELQCSLRRDVVDPDQSAAAAKLGLAPIWMAVNRQQELLRAS